MSIIFCKGITTTIGKELPILMKTRPRSSGGADVGYWDKSILSGQHSHDQREEKYISLDCTLN